MVVRVALLAGLLSTCSAAALAASPDPESKVAAWARKWLDATIERDGIEPGEIDFDAIVGAVVEKARQGGSSVELAELLTRSYKNAYYAFAPAGAQHDRRARYRLPFDTRIPRFVSQGPDGVTHQGEHFHSWDFVMPEGEWALAARSGRVGRVIDGCTEHGYERKTAPCGNAVYVVHEDGTFASYIHLQPGIRVRPGQEVKRGEKLGRSGNTGFSNAPHLHFGVMHRLESGETRSIPVRFGIGKGPSFVPELGQYYGRPPRPRRELRVHVDGEPVPKSDAAHVAWGRKVELKVELRQPSGAWVDVTDDDATRYSAMSPQALEIEGHEVTARPTPGFEFPGERIVRSPAGVYISHDRPQGTEFGVRQLWFLVEGAPESL